MNETNSITPVDLKTFYRESYKDSDLQSINRNNPIPHRCTIDGADFFYYNADLSGLMWIEDENNKLKYNDFVDVYRKGFAEGLSHLKAEEGIKRSDYNNPEQRELLKKDLSYFLYERNFIPNHKGLQDLGRKLLLRWTEKNIYTEGYYNGLLHSILTLAQELNLNIGVAQSTRATNQRPPAQAALKSYFPGIEVEKVNEIQRVFKDLPIGKDMAILIYLLTTEHKILVIDENNRKTGSRLHFLRAFTGRNLERSGGIGNFIEGGTGNLKVEKNDPAYIKISKRLEQMV